MIRQPIHPRDYVDDRFDSRIFRPANRDELIFVGVCIVAYILLGVLIGWLIWG